jgi:hypothetical protein
MRDTIRIACYADLHGQLSEPVECDLALIAGDVCDDVSSPEQYVYLMGRFQQWIGRFPRAAWIAGNHDLVCYRCVSMVPHYDEGHVYLRDESWLPFHAGRQGNEEFAAFKRLRIWGSPWSLPYGRGWAFMDDEDRIHRQLTSGSAKDCHIIMSHGPPYGYLDWAARVNSPGELTGSQALRWFVDLWAPVLTVCGHIHESRGVLTTAQGTTVVNAAMTGHKPRKCLEYGPHVVTLSAQGEKFAIEKVEAL